MMTPWSKEAPEDARPAGGDADENRAVEPPSLDTPALSRHDTDLHDEEEERGSGGVAAAGGGAAADATDPVRASASAQEATVQAPEEPAQLRRRARARMQRAPTTGAGGPDENPIRHSWHEVKKPWKARNTARAHSAGAAAPTVAPGRADTTLTLEQENAVLREELRRAHEDLAILEEVAQVCATQAPEMRAPRGARPAKRIQLGAILTQSLRLTGGGEKLAGGVGARSVFLCCAASQVPAPASRHRSTCFCAAKLARARAGACFCAAKLARACDSAHARARAT